MTRGDGWIEPLEANLRANHQSATLDRV